MQLLKRNQSTIKYKNYSGTMTLKTDSSGDYTGEYTESYSELKSGFCSNFVKKLKIKFKKIGKISKKVLQNRKKCVIIAITVIM